MTNTRLTCRLLCKIGLDHFGDEIPLVFHRDKFRAHHLKVLAEALRQSRRSIDSLTLVNVDYSALYGGDAIEYMYPVHGPNAQSPMSNFFELKALVQPLRRLRLFIQMICKKYEMHDHPTVPKRSVFTEARELRVLKIRLHDRRPEHELPPEKMNSDRDRVLEVIRMNIDLDYVFREKHYPHLYELSLANCKVYDSFTEFMLRHRQTLRRLSLNNMMLISWRLEHWSWLDTFSDIAGRLTNLHSITIRGFFFERDELMTDWHVPPTPEAIGTALSCPARDAIEEFVLTGGRPPWHQTFASGHDLLKPRWEPKPDGYVAPGIPDNNRPADDPAREYEEDEFDA